MSEILQYILRNPYEVSGFIATLICVWLNVKENVWGWLFAILASFCYIKLFYDIRLLGDMLLQIFFIAVSVYGWYEWLYGGKSHSKLTISQTPLQLVLPVFVIFLVSVFSFAFFLKWIGGDLIWFDAITTVISLLAQWMMARKYLENWLLWIFVDVVYVGMYVYKAVYLTALLYLILLIMAAMGYYSWKKLMRPSLTSIKTD